MSGWSLNRAVELYGQDKREILGKEVCYKLWQWEIADRTGRGIVPPSRALVFLWLSVRRFYARPLIVNSGFRSEENHKRIYKSLGLPAPMDSSHLLNIRGEFSALDIAFPGDRSVEGDRDDLNHLVDLGGLGLYETFFHIDSGEGRGKEHKAKFRRFGTKR